MLAIFVIRSSSPSVYTKEMMIIMARNLEHKSKVEFASKSQMKKKARKKIQRIFRDRPRQALVYNYNAISSLIATIRDQRLHGKEKKRKKLK